MVFLVGRYFRGENRVCVRSVHHFLPAQKLELQTSQLDNGRFRFSTEPLLGDESDMT